MHDLNFVHFLLISLIFRGKTCTCKNYRCKRRCHSSPHGNRKSLVRGVHRSLLYFCLRGSPIVRRNRGRAFQASNISDDEIYIRFEFSVRNISRSRIPDKFCLERRIYLPSFTSRPPQRNVAFFLRLHHRKLVFLPRGELSPKPPRCAGVVFPRDDRNGDISIPDISVRPGSEPPKARAIAEGEAQFIFFPPKKRIFKETGK